MTHKSAFQTEGGREKGHALFLFWKTFFLPFFLSSFLPSIFPSFLPSFLYLFIYFFLPSFFLSRIYLFIFRERGREGEREERSINEWLPLACPLLGTWPNNPGMWPDWESSRRPFGLQPALSPLIHTSQGCKTFLKSHRTLLFASHWPELSLYVPSTCEGDWVIRSFTWVSVTSSITGAWWRLRWCLLGGQEIRRAIFQQWQWLNIGKAKYVYILTLHSFSNLVLTPFFTWQSWKFE